MSENGPEAPADLGEDRPSPHSTPGSAEGPREETPEAAAAGDEDEQPG